MDKQKAYEAFKQWLEGENLTPEQYERELRIMADRLGI